MRGDDLLPEQQEQQKRRVPGRPFPKGRSGNPAGRPPGIRNRPAQVGHALLSRHLKDLAEKAVEKALAGDPAALRLCLERLIPRARERAVRLPLPPVQGAADIAPMMAAITATLARGEITPSEAGELGRLAEAFVRALDTCEFERRLRALEAAVAPGS